MSSELVVGWWTFGSHILGKVKCFSETVSFSSHPCPKVGTHTYNEKLHLFSRHNKNMFGLALNVSVR